MLGSPHSLALELIGERWRGGGYCLQLGFTFTILSPCSLERGLTASAAARKVIPGGSPAGPGWLTHPGELPQVGGCWNSCTKSLAPHLMPAQRPAMHLLMIMPCFGVLRAAIPGPHESWSYF